MWREQRRFALHHLRDLGLGKTAMEEQIREEISYLLAEIRNSSRPVAGQVVPICIHDLVTPSVSNNICILMFGHRYDYKHELRVQMDEALNQVTQLFLFTNRC